MKSLLLMLLICASPLMAKTKHECHMDKHVIIEHVFYMEYEACFNAHKLDIEDPMYIFYRGKIEAFEEVLSYLLFGEEARLLDY